MMRMTIINSKRVKPFSSLKNNLRIFLHLPSGRPYLAPARFSSAFIQADIYSCEYFSRGAHRLAPARFSSAFIQADTRHLGGVRTSFALIRANTYPPLVAMLPILKMGRNMAKTILPTTNPRKIISNGSIAEVRVSTLASTS